jgi:glutathione transport system substrate-binding protein
MLLPAVLAAAVLGMVVMSIAAPLAWAQKIPVIATEQAVVTLDPYDANDTISQAVAKSFYEGLYGFDKDMKMIPVLATGYAVSKDGLVYTVKLRQGVKFHDGTPFNAAAVKVNFDRASNPANKLKRYSLYQVIAKTEVVSPDTVRFTLKEPFSAFINTLAHPSGVMISPAALQKFGKDIFLNPVGTGPFEFVEWKHGDYVKGKKFAGYWRKGYPKVDGIVWKAVLDNNTRTVVMQTGEANFAFRIAPEQAAVLQSKPNIQVEATPSIVQRFLTMNELHKPFDDLKVRQAINYAIDKEALAKVAFAGYAVPAEGVVPPGVEFATKLGPWPYDPAKARALLKEAGYPNGFETDLWSAYNNTTAQKVIQFVQQQLAQVGIKVRVRALETGENVEKVLGAPDPQTAPVRLYYVGWSSSTGEADWAAAAAGLAVLAAEELQRRLLQERAG